MSMAKRKREEDRAGSAPARQLTHSPFATLAGAGAPSVTPPTLPAAPATPATPVPPVFKEKLVIRRELKGRGGKTVTRNSGLPAAQRDKLATQMKKRLGCGAVIEGDDVVLLGDLLDRAADWLTERGAPRVIKGN
jgi:translation initiation factor 1 (eIF-1/SUI1)